MSDIPKDLLRWTRETVALMEESGQSFVMIPLSVAKGLLESYPETLEISDSDFLSERGWDMVVSDDDCALAGCDNPLEWKQNGFYLCTKHAMDLETTYVAD